MNETSAFPAPGEGEKPEPAAINLEALPDEELQKIVKRGQAILAAREQKRRQDAAKEIRRLAKEFDLKVDSAKSAGAAGLRSRRRRRKAGHDENGAEIEAGVKILT